MNKVVFSDIDGTVYTAGTGGVPTKKLIDTVSELHKEGGLFILTTGNPSFSRMKNLAITLNADYLITSNGSLIQKRTDNKFEIIKKEAIKKEVINDLLKLDEKLHVQGGMWNENSCKLIKGTSKKLSEIYYRVFLDKDTETCDEAASVDEDMLKIEFLDNKEKIDLMQEKMIERKMNFARIEDKHIEITNQNATKGNACKYLCNELNINIKDIMTIGDTANDISMLEITPYSYAMGNASDQVKGVAKLHTSRAEQDGLAEAISDYIYRINHAK